MLDPADRLPQLREFSYAFLSRSSHILVAMIAHTRLRSLPLIAGERRASRFFIADVRKPSLKRLSLHIAICRITCRDRDPVVSGWVQGQWMGQVEATPFQEAEECSWGDTDTENLLSILICGLISELRHDLRRKEFQLPFGLIPPHQSLVEIPAKPFDVRVLAQGIEFSLDVINRTDQFVLRLHHALVGVRYRPGFAGETIRLEETKTGEVFDEAGALRVGAERVGFSVSVADMDGTKGADILAQFQPPTSFSGFVAISFA